MIIRDLKLEDFDVVNNLFLQIHSVAVFAVVLGVIIYTIVTL